VAVVVGLSLDEVASQSMSQDAGESDWEGEGGASAPEPKQETPPKVVTSVSMLRKIVQGFRRVVRPVMKNS
jgi:hypothetical protein